MVIKREMVFENGNKNVKHINLSRKSAKKLLRGKGNSRTEHRYWLGMFGFDRTFTVKNINRTSKPNRDLALLEELALANEL